MKNYLVIDLEATCWHKSDPEKKDSEIIEIGLAIMNSQNEIILQDGWFVKPLQNPILSPFCIELTSISQDNINTASDLKTALNRMQETIESLTGQSLKDDIFVSWGNYDRKMFERECKLRGIKYPFGTHVNLKAEYLRKHRLNSCGLMEALRRMKLPFEGTLHRGKDDAFNIAKILRDEFGAGFEFSKKT